MSSSDGTAPDPAPTGKGRPTPKRRDAQARRGPVAPPPTSRREAAKRVRQANAARRGTVKAGMQAGEEQFLMARDAGPVRRLVRDLVDNRRTAATFLLPAAVLPLAGSLSGSLVLANIATTLWLVALTVALADFVQATMRFRREIRVRFPDERRLRGHVTYGLVRMLQFRRLRVPRPAVQVGDPVR